MIDIILKQQLSESDWVRETRFGRWFLRTNNWYRYVVRLAVYDFNKMLNGRVADAPQLLDAGCGGGLAFSLLEQTFQPSTIIGVEVDADQFSIASDAAKRCKCDVKMENVTINELNIPNNSIDIIFCHQLIHHVADQTETLEAFYRMLKPGGVILISESCRSFVCSLPVRLLFRHPMQVQKSAQEYVELVRSVGFNVSEDDIKTSSPWWSHKDLGLTKWMGFAQEPKEVTEVLMIARKHF